MKRFIIRSTVFILTFAATLVVAGKILNRDHDNMTMEMSQATLPVITMLCEDTQYNQLHGYTVPMDITCQRETITILGDSRSTDLAIDTYGRQISSLEAEVRSTDGGRLIENIRFSEYPEEDGRVSLSISLKDLLERQEEYMLSLFLELDGWEKVYYYTRIVWIPENHLKNDLDYVLDFHRRLYDKEAARELVKYLETNPKLEDNRSFHKVNIHSSFQQLTWGNMQVSEVGTPVLTLKEINSQSTSFLVDYFVSVAGEHDATYYRMREHFRVKYTATRMYLLDYERTMTQIPDETALYAGDKILLGIVDEEVDMLENESGNVVAFTQAGRLFAYDVEEQEIIRLFSFYDGENQDARCVYGQHTVKILGVSEEGNVYFAVYGYMNRGTHEGENGIQINRYDEALNTVEEVAYIPWRQSYSCLKAQTDDLLYLNREEILYLSLDQAVYRVDLKSGGYTKLFDRLYDDCMQASADHHILVWQEMGKQVYSTEIQIRDLSEDVQVTLRGNSGEALKVLGFMNNDIIYGVARVSQIARQSTGQILFPMYKLCICKADGTVSKEYQQEGIFILDCSVEENQITLDRIRQNEDGGFVTCSQDHITRTVQEESGKNQVAVVDIDVYKRYVQIKVNGEMDSKSVRLLTPKEVIHEGKNELIIETDLPASGYFAYGPYGVDGIFFSPGNAVNMAYRNAGTVISVSGQIIWQKGKRSVRNQIMAITEPEKTEASESLASCLEAMLGHRGISVSAAELLGKGKYPADILREYMTDVSLIDATGCSLDAMLYYVDRDIPVLAMLRSKEAVLITGFNESQVVIFQPSAGRLYKRSTADAARWFEESGNCFFTYYP